MTSIKKKGFTFIETILYVALCLIVLGIVFSFGWNVISIREKTVTMHDTFSEVVLVNEVLKREIRSAIDIDKNDSIFNESPGKIALITDEGRVKIESVNDKISIIRNDNRVDFLHSDKVRIRNFVLTKKESAEEKIIYVGFSFNAESYYPQAGERHEYHYSVSARSGAEIRSQ